METILYFLWIGVGMYICQMISYGVFGIFSLIEWKGMILTNLFGITLGVGIANLSLGWGLYVVAYAAATAFAWHAHKNNLFYKHA